MSDSYPSEGQGASGQDQIGTSLVTTAADSQWAAGAGSGTSQSDTTTYSYDDAFSPGYGSSWSSSQTSDPSLSTFATTGNGGQQQYPASAATLVSPHVSVFSVPLSTNVPVVTDTIKVEETVPQQACFTADTLILMAEAPPKRIDQIRVGDEVLCKDDGDPYGAPRRRVVDSLKQHPPTALVSVHVLDEFGVELVSRTTGNHLIWTREAGWLQARKLEPGQHVIGHDNRLHEILKVVDNGEVEPVFNFSVAECHTYFIANQDGAMSVLVHNDYVTYEEGKNGVTLVYYQESLFGVADRPPVFIGSLQGNNVIHIAPDGTKTAASLDAVTSEVTSLGTTGNWGQWFNKNGVSAGAPAATNLEQEKGGAFALQLKLDEDSNAQRELQKQETIPKIIDGKTNSVDMAEATLEQVTVNTPIDVGLAMAGGLGPLHHIATNKNWISTLRGGPWSPRFAAIFEKAGMTLEAAANKINIPGHAGPHPEAYHKEVFDRLRRAVNGLSGEAYKNALMNELNALSQEATTAGTELNKLLNGE